MPFRVLLTRYSVPLLEGTSRKVVLNSSAACLVPKAHLALQEHQAPQEWWEEWVFLVKMAKMARMETRGTSEKKVRDLYLPSSPTRVDSICHGEGVLQSS